MRKTLVSSLLVAILLLVAVISVPVSSTMHVMASSAKAEAITEITESEFLSEYDKTVSRSVKLYDQAMNSYLTKTVDADGKENVKYSNDFAGVFIDDEGELNIATVEKSNNKSNYGGQVEYRQFTYSYNYLLKIQNALIPIMQDYSIFTVAIDEMLNKVSIYMENEKCIEQIVVYLCEQGLFNENSLNFIVEPNGGIIQNRTAYGGQQISKQLLGLVTSYGTICVNAIDNQTGRFGVLTNEHVAGNSTMYYDEDFGPKIGKTARSQNSGTIDAAFVPFDVQADWNPTTYAKYGSTTYTNISLGLESHIIQGLPVRKLGQNSGMTDGTITHTNSSTLINGNTLTNVIRYSNPSLSGDSGGPVYYNDGQYLYLIAMNYAGPANPSPSNTYGVGCRISEVMDNLDVTVLVNSYPVSTAQQLSNIRNHPSGNYFLVNDINLSIFGEWTPIPYLYPSGTVDGNGYTISGLTITNYAIENDTACVGLFGENLGTIKNLKMQDVNIAITPAAGDHRAVWSNVGAIAGFNNRTGVIKDVWAAGEIRVHRVYANVGGLVGRNFGTIQDSRFGHIIPYQWSLIEGNGDMGGISGTVEGGLIQNCITDAVELHHYLIYINRSVGGIVGYSTVSNLLDAQVFNTNIRNIGQHAATGFAPPMGIIVGYFHASGISAWAGNAYLWQGSLIGDPVLRTDQCWNFGRTELTHGWNWGGVVV